MASAEEKSPRDDSNTKRDQSTKAGSASSLADKEPKAAAAPKAALDSAAKSPREIWDDYFKKRRPSPAVVGQLLMNLHEERKHEHVIAAIEAALKNGQSQPWMYDVLALSMELAGRPQAEIERVLLSRVDFTATELPSMMYSAAYLTRFGGKKQALRLYRQASQIEPTRPEPYVLGLPLAQAAKDPEAIQWAATGILVSAWGRDHEKLHTQAGDAAAEAIRELKKNGKEDEAAAFEKAMADARKRDLVLKLVWSGEGDLDLSVVEPPGTVCSVNEPQSPGGGVHLRDGYGPNQKNCREDYICAFGVPGNYRIKVRHSGGNIVGKRAQLTMTRHQGSPEESTQTITIPISNEDATVLLSLPNGRRTSLRAIEPKEKAESTARGGAPVLQQVVPGEGSADVLRKFAASRARADINAGIPSAKVKARSASMTSNAFQIGTPGGAGGAGSAAAFATGATVGGGAVGYTPVIETISEGVSMSALAVVSADRRYVRLSVAPVFNAITDVFTFTFLNAPGGSAGSQQPGN